MDNTNNNFEKKEGDYTPPVSESESVQGESRYSQGKYPQPPEWTKNIVISEKPWLSPYDDGNVSVELNKPEKEETSSETADLPEKTIVKKEWPIWLQIGVIVVIALIAALLVKNAVELRTSPSEKVSAAVNSSVVIPSSTTAIPTTASVTAPTTVSSTADKNATVTGEKTTSAKKEEKTTAASDKKPSSDNNEGKDEAQAKEKIVEYFNESSNRVKTEATKVVKNFEKRTHNEDKLVLPSAIKGIAKSVLESKITDITEPVEYSSTEAIVARYPVPGEEKSSYLDADDVESAVCTETDGEYEITLVLKSCVDPEPGKGTSKAMDCLDVPTVRDTAPEFITAFSAEYYDCVIRCRVEKETGRIIWSSYTAPVLIKVGLDAGFVAFDAEIGLTFEKDYTISY